MIQAYSSPLAARGSMLLTRGLAERTVRPVAQQHGAQRVQAAWRAPRSALKAGVAASTVLRAHERAAGGLAPLLLRGAARAASALTDSQLTATLPAVEGGCRVLHAGLRMLGFACMHAATVGQPGRHGAAAPPSDARATR